MRVGIEMGQLHHPQSGGIVPLVQHVLKELFSLAPDDLFFVYRTEANPKLIEPPPANVSQITLRTNRIWRELGWLAGRDRLDVLFRTFPLQEPVAFPMGKQIFLVPDLQHEVMPKFFSLPVLGSREAAFTATFMRAGAIAVLAEHGRQLLYERHPGISGEVFLLSPAATVSEETVETPLDPEAAMPQEPFFLFPANLWPHKNHRRLIAAFSRFRDRSKRSMALVFTGDPVNWPKMRGHCGKMPVHHLGFVNRRHLAELYRRALALTYFSLYEGFGMPLLEAFHLGTPVLCSNTTSLPEIGGDAVLSCDPTDVSAMADLMVRIAEDEGLRDHMIQEGKKRLAVYTWRKSAQNLCDVCRRLANKQIAPKRERHQWNCLMGTPGFPGPLPCAG